MAAVRVVGAVAAVCAQSPVTQLRVVLPADSLTERYLVRV